MPLRRHILFWITHNNEISHSYCLKDSRIEFLFHSFKLPLPAPYPDVLDKKLMIASLRIDDDGVWKVDDVSSLAFFYANTSANISNHDFGRNFSAMFSLISKVQLNELIKN